MPRRRPYAGRGFIPDRIRGSKELYQYFWNLSEGKQFADDPSENEQIRSKVQHFLAHLYNSMYSQLVRIDPITLDFEDINSDLFIPVYSRLLDKEFGRDFDVLSLKKTHGLIELKGSDMVRKASRHYRLPLAVFRKACSIEYQSTEALWQSLVKGSYEKRHSYNIVNGKPYRNIRRSVFERRNQGFRTPDLIKNAIKALSPCIFDPKYVGNLVNYKEGTSHIISKEIRELLKKDDLTKENRNSLESLSKNIEQSAANERSSQKAILFQQPKLSELRNDRNEPLYEYQAAYTPQISGRISEIGGGLQNASRVFKHNAFKYIKVAYNYDLVGSQANILRYELQKSSIDNSWITSYIETNNAKEIYSKLIGIDDTGIWKRCLYSTIMGSEPHLHDSAARKAIREHYQLKYPGQDISKREKEALDRFIDVAGGLITSCRNWRNYIVSPESHYMYNSRKDGIRHWQNACGMKHKVYGLNRKDLLIEMEDYYEHRENSEHTLEPLGQRKTAEAKRKIAAFILQGREACFIHHLTILCAENGIKVYRNEHDGIIVNQKIPKKLVLKASKRSGLPNAQIEKKRLASKEDIRKVKAQRQMQIHV